MDTPAILYPKRFPIGTVFKSGGKQPRICTVTDYLTTRNLAGKVTGERYIATHEFLGQTVRDESVPRCAIGMRLVSMPPAAKPGTATEQAYVSAAALIAQGEALVRDAAAEELIPALTAAGGRLLVMVRASVRASSTSVYVRFFSGVRLEEGRVFFEYHPHNANPGGVPDLYPLDRIDIGDLTELVRAALSNPVATAA